MTDLCRFFSTFISQLNGKLQAEDDSYVFTVENLPPPPEMLEAESICLTRGIHWYGGDFPIDSIHIESDKASLTALGVLILSVVFHRPQHGVFLNSSHSRSTLKRLRIESHDINRSMSGVQVALESFIYRPWHSVKKHPWLEEGIDPFDLPVAFLEKEGGILSWKDMDERDTVVGFGAPLGACRFAELLLNAGRAGSLRNEFALESEMGFRGVGLASAELKIWLPGSLGYLDAPVDETDSLVLPKLVPKSGEDRS